MYEDKQKTKKYFNDVLNGKFKVLDVEEYGTINKTKVQEFIKNGRNISSQEAYDEDLFDDILLELNVPNEVIRAVVSINGNSLDTYNDILYYATGYNDLEQINE